MDKELPPHHLVRVHLAMGSPEYVVTATSLHGWEYNDWFEEIGNFLAARPGWHCDLTSDSGILWSFGAFGASLFNISPPESASTVTGRFSLFDYDADEVLAFNTIDELRGWLELNEHRHADHAHKLRDMIASLDWAYLKRGSLEARVQFSDGAWIGTIPGLPAEATFGRTLPEVVRALQDMVASVIDVPADVVRDIRFELTVDAAGVGVLAADESG